MISGSKARNKKLEETLEEPTPTPAPAPKKAPTEPWNPESQEDAAIKHGTLGLPHGKKGFALRWVRMDAIDRRKMQGYVLSDPAFYDAQPDENGMMRRNELVLMEVPLATYQARREEVAKQTDLQKRAAKTEFLREREKASRETGHRLADEKDDE